MLALMKAEEGAQTNHTVLSFEVSDIASEIRELAGRGQAPRRASRRIAATGPGLTR